MTLKEKFETKVSIDTKKEAKIFANECEQIADEFAIVFAEWKDGNFFNQEDGFYNRNYKDEAFTLKELLEIFKKEKGL